MPLPRSRKARVASATQRKRAARLRFDNLETRQLLTAVSEIVAGQLYQDVAFLDSNGDTVSVTMQGPTAEGRGFTLRLSGEATTNADIHTMHLVGMTGENGLNVSVTPNELTINAGPDYNKMYSSGYTNITQITAQDTSAVGGIRLSAAIVNNIALPEVDIHSITLDTGMVTFVDRVNSSTLSSINISAPAITITSPISGEAEVFDESPVGPASAYNPTAGLIDLGNIRARNIGSIVVNGSISAATLDPFDVTDLTNDLRGVIDVSGTIGSIVAPRSAMRNAVRAGGIDSVQLGRIDGEITTRDASQSTTVYLPRQFTGFLTTAGHLNLGFTDESGQLMTGNIRAGGGVSGSDPSEADPVLVPDKYAAAVVNTSTARGIADIQFNGSALSRWSSASSIGNITANVFEAGAMFDAGTDIGNIEMLMPTVAAPESTAQAATRTPAVMEGYFQAGGNIGNIKSATNLKAEVIAGGNIGNITGLAGGINSTVVLAGGNIGDITVFQAEASTTQISAGGDIGNIRVYSGSVGWKVKATNIGNILVDSGSLNLAVFAATTDLGDVTVTSAEGTAIEGGSLIAGNTIGQVTAYAFAGTGIKGTLIQGGHLDGGKIAGVTGISYGSLLLPAVTAGVPSSVASTNNGIDAAQILAAEIGSIWGQAHVGTGISQAVIHSQIGSIASVTGIGNGDGIYKATVVAEQAIGPIQGRSTVSGAGIKEGSFHANGKGSGRSEEAEAANAALGTIGQVTAQGGPAGGHGIKDVRFQASNRIAGMNATSNANGGNAMDTVTAIGTSFGPVEATVLGGKDGKGIVDSSFRAWSDYANKRPEVQMDSIRVDVRSELGTGITNTVFKTKGDITTIWARALNASAITESKFELSQGNIDRIYAQSVNSGNAINETEFIASNGSIGSARTLDEAKTSGIVALSQGTSFLANGIVNSTFMADANIGFIRAETRGGTAISGSTFIADSNYGSARNRPNLPGTEIDETDLGALFGIYAKTEGENGILSAGISDSTFQGESISSVTVEVTDREEGGAGISGSMFSASNAVYDGMGNFNNEGTIGAITVVNGSLRANGIETSQFLAGAAGSIGDINVTVLGGSGITESEFRAALFDFDQSRFSSTIGNINVNVGRAGSQVLPTAPPPNDAWTVVPAGIDTSYFAANGGIGNVTVNSIGTGVALSAFLASFDAYTTFGSLPGLILPLLTENVTGNLGNVTINATGRYGFGSVLSLYAGDSVGDIKIQVASRDTNVVPLQNVDLSQSPSGQALEKASQKVAFSLGSLIGPAASAGSIYLGLNGNLGRVTVGNAGAGFGSVASAYVALPFGSYGPVKLVGRSLLNLFWALPRLAGGGASTQAESIEPTSGGVTIMAAGRQSDTLRFAVNFSAAVDVTGTPWFLVNVGENLRRAEYVSGSGTAQLVFRVALQPGEAGDVVIPPGTSLNIDLANRIVESATGFLVNNLTPGVVPTRQIRIDRQAATVTGVSEVISPKRRYAVGQTLTVRVTFSEAVTVEGLPQILLAFKKNQTRWMIYSGGSGTNTLEFSYRLTRADVAMKKRATISGSIVLPEGAAIFDLAGNVSDLPAAPTETLMRRPVNRRSLVPLQARAIHPRGPIWANRAASLNA